MSAPLRHLAIIMDGNGRWAEARGMSRGEGHRRGADAVDAATKSAIKQGIKYLTLYAFSTENWKRSKLEVSTLMLLLEQFLDEKLSELAKEGIRLNMIGRMEGLPGSVQRKLQKAMDATAGNDRLVLTLALNYGGRPEIADAAKRLAEDVAAGLVKPGKVDEALFAKYLYDPELPDVDLLIRTSGELRLSNFLLWQIAYAELYVTDVLWPDFDEAEMEKALMAYGQRDRRFGARKK